MVAATKEFLLPWEEGAEPVNPTQAEKFPWRQQTSDELLVSGDEYLAGVQILALEIHHNHNAPHLPRKYDRAFGDSQWTKRGHVWHFSLCAAENQAVQKIEAWGAAILESISFSNRIVAENVRTFHQPIALRRGALLEVRWRVP